MPDGIKSGVAEQLGQLGKHIAQEVVKAPVKIAGINETAGQGTGGKKQGNTTKSAINNQSGNSDKSLESIKAEDEILKRQQLAQARRLLQQFIEPPQEVSTLREQMEQEEMEKKKKEIENEKKKAASLPQISSKPKRGNLYGVKHKQQGSELGKNVKSG